jgi:hypothetical protein
METDSKYVWVVETWERSDYSVLAIYSTEAAAAALVDGLRTAAGGDGVGPSYAYDSRVLDPVGPDPSTGLWLYRVRIGRDGRVDWCHVVAPKADLYAYGVPQKDTYRSVCTQSRVVTNAALITEMLARDQDHAIKIADERRIAKIAAGEWPEMTS